MARRFPFVVLAVCVASIARGQGPQVDAPTRVDVAAETARMMARMPEVRPGQRRVLEAATEARTLIETARDAATETGDHNTFFQALTGYYYGYEDEETADVRAARVRNVRALDDAGFAALVDEMAKGSPASDVAFLPFDVPGRINFHTLVTDALEARMRVAIEDGDLLAYAQSLDAAMAIVRSKELRPDVVGRVECDMMREALYTELCATISRTSDAAVLKVINDAMAKMEPRDATRVVEYLRVNMHDWTAAIFADPTLHAEVAAAPAKVLPSWMKGSMLEYRVSSGLKGENPRTLGQFRENIDTINAVANWALRNAKKDPWARESEMDLEESVPKAGSLVLPLLTQLLLRADGQLPEVATWERGVRVAIAVELHHAAKGSYPASLADLVEGRSDGNSFARDPHANAMFRYEVDSDASGVRIWSVGPNGKDEDGKGDDVVVFEK